MVKSLSTFVDAKVDGWLIHRQQPPLISEWFFIVDDFLDAFVDIEFNIDMYSTMSTIFKN